MIIEFNTRITLNFFKKCDVSCKLVNFDKHTIAIFPEEINICNSFMDILRKHPKVKNIIKCDTKYQMVSKKYSNIFQININNILINNKTFHVIAGPCSVESEDQIHAIAKEVAAAGAGVLRGGAFKARTSPYSFSGIGRDGVRFLRDAAEDNGMLSITEVLDVKELEYISEHVDIIQIGSRNMHNFILLKEAAKTAKPILLKRGFNATYEELLLAAEHICSEGNMQVILCERGIKTFENYTRNTLDICAVPALKQLSFLPVFVDPSHGTGLRELVAPMSLASVASGANGLMLEVHTNPELAYSDSKQTISTKAFATLMKKINLARSIFDDGGINE